MDREKTDGRETQTWSQKGKSKFISDAGNEKTITGDSRHDETQSQRTFGKMGESLVRNGVTRTAGGISGLLRGITNDFIAYLDAHGERLETRLIENKKAKSNILKQASALEAELARLLEQAEYLPEDSTESE